MKNVSIEKRFECGKYRIILDTNLEKSTTEITIFGEDDQIVLMQDQEIAIDVANIILEVIKN